MPFDQAGQRRDEFDVDDDRDDVNEKDDEDDDNDEEEDGTRLRRAKGLRGSEKCVSNDGKCFDKEDDNECDSDSMSKIWVALSRIIVNKTITDIGLLCRRLFDDEQILRNLEGISSHEHPIVFVAIVGVSEKS